MKKLTITCLLVWGLCGCKKEEWNDPILIRVENRTSLKLENVRIISYVDSEPFRVEKKYGDLGASEISTYVGHSIVRSNVEYMYRMADTEMEISARCGTGSTYLQSGKYTLHLRQDRNGLLFEEITRN